MHHRAGAGRPCEGPPLPLCLLGTLEPSLLLPSYSLTHDLPHPVPPTSPGPPPQRTWTKTSEACAHFPANPGPDRCVRTDISFELVGEWLQWVYGAMLIIQEAGHALSWGSDPEMKEGRETGARCSGRRGVASISRSPSPRPSVAGPPASWSD